MQIVLRRRPNCWTGQFRGHPRPDYPTCELPLPYTPDASADFVYAEVGRRFPQARIFHVIDRCEGCAS
jgi:hypothetical protein